MIRRLPAAPVQHERRLHVLDDRVGREAADVVQRRATKHAAAAAEEGAAPVILAGLQQRVEDAILLPQTARLLVHHVRERIRVVEILRRLNEAHLRIVEVTQQPMDDVRQRHVVGVELQNEIRRRHRDRVIQVAGFRVRVADPADVADAELFRQLAQIVPLAVVEDVRAVRIADRARPDRRAPHDLERLVVDRDEDVDVTPGRRRRRLPIRQVPRVRDEQERADQTPRLRHRERDREDHRVRIQRLRPAPPDPVQAEQQRDHRQRADDALLLRGQRRQLTPADVRRPRLETADCIRFLLLHSTSSAGPCRPE
jgi:hypothetical protein